MQLWWLRVRGWSPLKSALQEGTFLVDVSPTPMLVSRLWYSPRLNYAQVARGWDPAKFMAYHLAMLPQILPCEITYVTDEVQLFSISCSYFEGPGGKQV